MLYEVDNPLKAFDIAFKIFHALDYKYPKECQREWFFMERCVYGMNQDKKDELIGKTSSIRNDYANFKRVD